MAKLLAGEPWAQDIYADGVRDRLAKFRQLHHLRVRRHADLLVIESGSGSDPIAHARLRRQTVHLWRLEMATHAGRWQRTPMRGTLDELVDALVHNFGWTLALRE